jgi:hypothetical protein
MRIHALSPSQALNLFQDPLLEISLDFVALVVSRSRLAMKSHECTEVKLGLFNKFNLTNASLGMVLDAAIINA